MDSDNLDVNTESLGRFGKKSKEKKAIIPITPAALPGGGGAISGLVSVAGSAGGIAGLAGGGMGAAAGGLAGVAGLGGLAGSALGGGSAGLWGLGALLGSKAAVMGVLLGATLLTAGAGAMYNMMGSSSPAHYREGLFQNQAYQSMISDAAQERASTVESQRGKKAASSLDLVRQEVKKDGMFSETAPAPGADGRVDAPAAPVSGAPAPVAESAGAINPVVPAMKKSAGFNSELSGSLSSGRLSGGGGMSGGIGKQFQPVAAPMEDRRAVLASSAKDAGRGSSARASGARRAGAYGQSGGSSGNFASRSPYYSVTNADYGKTETDNSFGGGSARGASGSRMAARAGSESGGSYSVAGAAAARTQGGGSGSVGDYAASRAGGGATSDRFSEAEAGGLPHASPNSKSPEKAGLAAESVSSEASGGARDKAAQAAESGSGQPGGGTRTEAKAGKSGDKVFTDASAEAGRIMDKASGGKKASGSGSGDGDGVVKAALGSLSTPGSAMARDLQGRALSGVAGKASRSSAFGGNSKLAGSSTPSFGSANAGTAYGQVVAVNRVMSGAKSRDLSVSKAAAVDAFENGSAGGQGAATSGGVSSSNANVPPGLSNCGDNANVSYPVEVSGTIPQPSQQDSTPWEDNTNKTMMLLMLALLLMMLAKMLASNEKTKPQAKQAQAGAEGAAQGISDIGGQDSSGFGQSDSGQVGANTSELGASTGAAAASII
ncbi:MAG: hypothetical protein WC421_03945 [Elusimicrobiales bacterium]